MIEQLWVWFSGQLDNEIFGGLAAVSLLGYAGYVFRAVPSRLFQFFKLQFTTEVTVRSDDQMFFIVAEWLGKQEFMGRSRRLKILTKSSRRMDTPMTAAQSSEESRPEYLFVPAPGLHYFWYNNCPVLLQIDDGQGGKPDGRQFIIIENITMRTIGRNPATFAALMDEALAQIKSERRIRVTTHGEYGWRGQQTKLPRPLSSVITIDDIGERLLEDMRAFFQSQTWYVQRGIPWRRGYMLSGPPGTGKSSLVFALASELSIPIFSLSLGTAIDDGGLAGLLADIPERSILLIEDVDTFDVSQSRKIEKNGEKKEYISLSGLLNALDGVIAGEGRTVIMTTNHPENLDAALTRAGRIDRSETLSLFSPDESVRMWRLFFGEHHAFEGHFSQRVRSQVQPAALQEHFMRYRDNPHNAAIHANRVGGQLSKIA